MNRRGHCAIVSWPTAVLIALLWLIIPVVLASAVRGHRPAAAIIWWLRHDIPNPVGSPCAA